MSFYRKVSEQYLIKIRKLGEQQKDQKALEIKNRILKQTHDIKLAKSLSPNTKKLDESTKKIGEVLKESNSEDDLKSNIIALPNNSKFGKSMREMIGSLMNCRNSLNVTRDEPGTANFLGVRIHRSEADTMKINESIYDLTPGIYKAFSSTSYTGKTMKNENYILTMYNIVRDLGYTGVDDKKSNRKTFFTITLPKLFDDIQNKTFDEVTDDSDDLQGGRVKTTILSNIIDIYPRFEFLL